MDDGELDFSNQQVFSSPNMVEIPSSSYLDSLCNEFLKDTYACTHTHTCNPPGPDFSHTHTCYHVHTKIVPAPAEDQVATDDTAESAEKKSKKRPLGNKEAVRKYREKKKANAASLEDEVVKLRALNQHLMKKLQAQAPLEAEIARLKCLLVDIRGRIEGEIGSFPYQKSPNSANPPMANLPGSYVMNPCNMQCDDRVYCLHPEGKTVEEASLNGEGFGGCEFESLQCLASQNLGAKDLPTCGVEQTVANVNSSASNKRKDCVSKNQTLIDGYLEVYEGLCGVKKVCLSGQILAGSSIRSILVREAKNHAALALVVGGRAATAKYCAKRLPPTTNVLAIRDSRIVFRRCTNQQLPVAAGSLIVDPRPSLTVTENLGDEEIQSEFGGSVLEIEKSTRENTLDLKEEAFNGSEMCKSRSKSMFAGDPVEQKLGWPLLRRASSGMSQTLHARDMSVVQWVMTLPDRSPYRSPHFSSIEENPFQRAISDIKDDSSTSSSPQSVLLPEGLEMFNVNSLNCNWFSLEVLKSCTNQFSSENLIGKGGSNRVYKGVLPDGKPIAVKVMQSSKEAWKGFELEVEIISSLKHKSITPLLGICVEANTLISVYDYFPQGSLEENLHGKNKDGSVLSWEVRFNVAVAIAEALDYLHREALKPVIHRDVKSSNILLSYMFEPQLSDFGLAIWGPTTSSFLTQEDVVGTFGYLAPEYFMYGKVSDKIDVYSFGVVLLELISGREPISSEPCKGQESLVVWAKPIIESGDIKGLLDPNFEGKFVEAQLQRMVLAASLCITRSCRLRPKLNQILKILKGDEVEYFFDSYENESEDSENQENIDDEVYPNSSADLHLSLALLGVEDDNTSHSSTDHSCSEPMKEQWSRSSSFNS